MVMDRISTETHCPTDNSSEPWFIPLLKEREGIQENKPELVKVHPKETEVYSDCPFLRVKFCSSKMWFTPVVTGTFGILLH